MPLREFVARYGEKAYYILKAMIIASRKTHIKSLGDFSLKELRRALAEMGIEYNPSLLLSKLEKEYGIIETTYKSSGQRWWKILDEDAVLKIIREWEGVPDNDPDDPRLKLLRIQFYSVKPDEILDILTRLAQRKRLTRADRDKLKAIAFHELPLIVDFLEKASTEYPEELAGEIALAETILEIAEEVVSKKPRRESYSKTLEPTLKGSLRETF